MSENMEAIDRAISKCRDMRCIIELYESGKIQAGPGFEFTLTAGNITELKQAFAAVFPDKTWEDLE